MDQQRRSAAGLMTRSSAFHPNMKKFGGFPMCQYPVKRVKAGAIAFREMDRKIFVYRVHSGALCLTNSQSAAVAFAFPEDFVGLGFLEHHTEVATAVVDTTIECLPREAQQELAAVDPRYRDQLDAATEKEFEHQRLRLSAAAAKSPITRVAYYLLALSSINMREGMDSNIVEEPSAPAASYLQITEDQLTHILSLFRTLDLVKPAGQNRLNIKDLDRLRNIADAGIRKAPGSAYRTSVSSVEESTELKMCGGVMGVISDKRTY
jgi:CRP-like cAMP-binding protein